MSTISCTIGGNSVIIANASFSLANALENRSILTLTVLDSPGTANYTPGQPVVFTDSVQGITYSGYVNTSKPTKLGIAGAFVAHVVTCVDKQRLLDKRANKNNYLNWYAGDIATNFIDTTLAAEGVTAAYATRRDTTASDFNKGILSGVAGTSNVGDGDLELTLAGTSVTITENTTANFATGMLIGTNAANNTLTPILQSAISFQSKLPLNVGNDYIYVSIWSGSMVVGTLDYLHYEIWISSATKQPMAGVDLTFSDGTFLHSTTGVGADVNGIGPSPYNDLTGYAVDTWYKRDIALGASLNGKTITAVTLAFAGTNVDTYQAYFKNIYLASQSGSKFFSTSATVTNVNPPQIVQSAGYVANATSAKVVQVFDPTACSRVSTAYSIDAVKLLRSSLLSWIAVTPGSSTFVLNVSYDGGNSYLPCINNSALPALPAGSNVAGLSILLQEIPGTTGTDPTIYPYLQSVVITLQSAPNATKNDIVTRFTSQANWNTGTLTGTVANANGDLVLGTFSRNWNDNSLAGQTLFASGGVTQSAASGAYVMTVPASSFGTSRFDFAGFVADFTYDIDVTIGAINSQYGILYRQYGWVATNNTSGYGVMLDTGQIQLGYGTNSNTGGGGYTLLKSVAQSFSAGSTHHVKLVVSNAVHLVYLDNATTPIINLTDSTYTNAGYIGCRCYNFDSSSHSGTWDNLVLNPLVTGTWVSPSASISSLTTCGPSVITWTEVNTTNQAISSIVVQTSVDGGGTYQTCTNGSSVPNIPSGTTVTGKSIIVKALFTTTSQTLGPILRQLVWRVLGQYPGSTGTRSTLPLAYDTAIRANVGSGFGVGTDGQTYTQIGTATTNLTSNKLQITNTTGDVHMLYGSRVAGDCEGTVRFTLSASSIVFGMELHYGDVNNYYRFYASTTTLTIQKRIAGTSTTLQTASMALATGTAYRMRFRIVGSGPVNLYGKVWASGILEPTSWGITATDT